MLWNSFFPGHHLLLATLSKQISRRITGRHAGIIIAKLMILVRSNSLRSSAPDWFPHLAPPKGVVHQGGTFRIFPLRIFAQTIYMGFDYKQLSNPVNFLLPLGLNRNLIFSLKVSQKYTAFLKKTRTKYRSEGKIILREWILPSLTPTSEVSDRSRKPRWRV